MEIPYPDARSLAESGFRKLDRARQLWRVGDVNPEDGAEVTEDAGLAEVYKAYVLARARIQQAREDGSIGQGTCPVWLSNLGHRLAAKYNACAMSDLEYVTTQAHSAGAVAQLASGPAVANKNNPEEYASSSPLARTLPSFQASNSPTRSNPGGKVNTNNNVNTLLPSTTSFEYRESRKVSKNLERRMKMLGQVIELTRSQGLANVLNDEDRLRIRATTFTNLAIVHRQASRPHMALRCLVRVAELESMVLDADHATTHLNMAAVLSTLKRHRDALGHANIAIRLLSERLETLGGAGDANNNSESNTSPEDSNSQEEIQKVRSLLAVAHYNSAVEREHLKHRSSCLSSYRSALKVAKQQLGSEHPVVNSIASSIADCSVGSVSGYKLPRPPKSPRSPFVPMSPRNLKRLGLGKKSPIGDIDPAGKSPMAGVKRIKRYGSLAEEVVAVFKEAMESKRVLNGDVIETLEDIFMAIDRDGGGTVSLQEFKIGLNRLSIILTPRSLDALVKSIDTDGDGEINFAEFVAYMNQKFEQRKATRHSEGVASRRVVSKDAQRRKERARKLAALRKASPTLSSPVTGKENGDEDPPVEEIESRTPKMYSDLSEQQITNALHALFSKFDVDGSGAIELDELKKMLSDLPTEAGMEEETVFSDSDAERILEAFDEDGNGLVEETEWGQWIQDGLKRSKEDRERFATVSPLARKLSLFLNAIERLVLAFESSPQ
eukprot:g4215.t1